MNELEKIYAKLLKQPIVIASGNSEGAKKGWESRGWQKASGTKYAHQIFAGKGGKGPKGATHSGFVTSFDEGKTYVTQLTRLNPKHGGESGGKWTSSEGHKSLEEGMSHVEKFLPSENRHGDLYAK